MTSRRSHSFHGQFWTMDMIVSLSMFFGVLFILFFFEHSFFALITTESEALGAYASKVADQLMSEGYPSSWNTTLAAASSSEFCARASEGNMTFGILEDAWTMKISSHKIALLQQINSSCGYEVFRASYRTPVDIFVSLTPLNTSMGMRREGSSRYIVRRVGMLNTSAAEVTIEIFR